MRNILHFYNLRLQSETEESKIDKCIEEEISFVLELLHQRTNQSDNLFPMFCAKNEKASSYDTKHNC